MKIAQSTNTPDKLSATLQSFIDEVRAREIGKPEIFSSRFSSKVQKLYYVLSHDHSRAPETRSIVFVNQRSTANLLCYLFICLQEKNIRPGFIVGAKQKGLDWALTIKEQVLNLVEFRQGKLNCMVMLAQLV